MGNRLDTPTEAGTVLYSLYSLLSILFEMVLSEVGVIAFENKFQFLVSYKYCLYFKRSIYGQSSRVCAIDKIH